MDPGHRSLIACAVVWALAAAGCDESTEPPQDAWMSQACEAEDADIGRCVVAGSGAPCTGALDEQQQFESFGMDGAMGYVVGPQGASMFVLAVRTSGIHPGDPDDPTSPDNPEVTLGLIREGGEQVARYRGRPYFEADPNAPPARVAPGLFVIMEGASELLGESVTARVDVVDRDDVLRCGTAQFSVRSN